MNLIHPERLWLLGVVVGLAAVHVVVHRRRARAIARYSNPDLVHSVAPDRVGRRRHVPTALALAALAAIVLALAQPTRLEAVPREQGVVVLAIDVSASMEATDISPSRIDAAIAGAKDFVADVPEGIHIGVVAFDGGARLLVAPTVDRAAVLDAIDGLSVGPGTAAGEGVFTSLDAIEAALTPDVVASGDDLPAALVLLSDGTTTVGRSVQDAARAAADAGIPITTIAFGTPTGTVTIRGEVVGVPADTTTMAAVARATGGQYFEATTAGELEDVYADIRTAIGTTDEQRDISRPVLAGALTLVAAATALSVLWTGRAL